MKKIGSFLLLLFFVSSSIFSQKNGTDWKTYFEKSGYVSTPNYKETIDYFKRLEKYSPYAKMISFGRTPQNREMYCMIVSKDKAFTIDKAKKSTNRF